MNMWVAGKRYTESLLRLMSKDCNHHYVPQFHLKKWEDSDELVTTWWRIDHTGEMFVSRKSSASVAYAPGLYTLQHVPQGDSQEIESSIFSNAVEVKAAPILDKIISGGLNKLSEVEKQWWAIYLNSSVLRLPHNIERLRDSAREHAAASFARDPEEYEAVKGGSPERTLLEWVAARDPALLSNLHLKVMEKMLAKPEIINRLLGLNWIARDSSASSITLLLGDSPFLSVFPLFSEGALVAIPLSPKTLFVATEDEKAIHRILEMRPAELVKATNIESLKNTRKLAFGNAERVFVDRYFPS